MAVDDCDECNAKGPWKQEEDDMLRDLIAKHGTSNWSVIAKEMVGRNGKSCRLRWFNQLCPDLKKEPFTAQEDALIIEAHAAHGNRWSLIAKMMKGRTDNAVKNRWNSTLKRRVTNSGGAAAYATANGSGLIPNLTGGNELRELKEHFETVSRMLSISAEQSEGRLDADVGQLMKHINAMRALLMPTLDSQTATSAPQQPSEALHFADAEPDAPLSGWDVNPMRRMPGLAADAKEAAARALEELDEEEASAYSQLRPSTSGNGYHSPDLKADSAMLSQSSLPCPLRLAGGSSLKRSHEEFLEARQHSAMSAGTPQMSSQLAWHACAPRQMSAAGNFAVSGRHSQYAPREDILAFADRLEAQGSCPPRHLLSQQSAGAHPQHTAHYEAQLYRRYSAPVGSIRLEHEAFVVSTKPPQPAHPVQAVPPHMQAGKRARATPPPLPQDPLYNPFNNIPDQGDFLFYSPGADGLDHFEQPLAAMAERKGSATLTAEALPHSLH